MSSLISLTPYFSSCLHCLSTVGELVGEPGLETRTEVQAVVVTATVGAVVVQGPGELSLIGGAPEETEWISSRKTERVGTLFLKNISYLFLWRT